MRLDKFVLKSTLCTKSEVTEQISLGHIRVNGAVNTDITSQVHEDNVIQLNGQTLVTRPFRYMLMHKQADTLCSNVDGHYPSLLNNIDINHKDELHIVGRLDADTTGLVLITDDGRWSYNITRPECVCTKVYRVQLAKPINIDAVALFKQGILLQGESKPTLPAELIIMSAKEVLLSLTEGRYHQVKRMFFAIGNRVNALHRQQIGNVSLDIVAGEWRDLTADEVSSFQ
ncbi:pseudouridine synthase [Shewanella sp. OMA3-2]|uniref:pseudouridine synthase n=1 Tax=Shewanella sp. OMA3-2 TaxID=2908650 RepID=UPI001F2D6DB1|nr:pseudouridine synthase [Shewanella sp. OMA3-2]UJF20858.1 pseudouridine synthase [Shewanella sp. OMA3-2]